MSVTEKTEIWQRWRRGESLSDIGRALDRIPGAAKFESWTSRKFRTEGREPASRKVKDDSVGLFFEDFESDRRFTSRGRTVTETDIVVFAGLSGDFVERHTNEEYARQSAFGRRIAHGALIFSLSIGLTTQMNLIDDTLLAFSGVDKLRFVQPVFPECGSVDVAKEVTHQYSYGQCGLQFAGFRLGPLRFSL